MGPSLRFSAAGAFLLLMLIAGCSRNVQPRVIAVVMKKYSITPAEIRVKSGETIRFEVVTTDVQHGFDIPDLGIKEPVQPGKPAVFEFKARKAGSYGIECGIICGPRHDEMAARLIIE